MVMRPPSSLPRRLLRTLLALTLALTALAGLPFPASAASYTVAAGVVSDASGNGICSLEEALIAATTSLSGSNDCGSYDGPAASTITLPAGTYTITAPLTNAASNSAFPAIDAATGSLTLQGAGADQTVIVRDAAAGQFRFFYVYGGSLTL